MKIYEHDIGHMVKMSAMPIYGKNPSKIFPITSGLISTKLRMKYLGLRSIVKMVTLGRP